MSADLTQVEAVVLEAHVEAAKACRAYLAAHGDRDACGFAWVNVWGVRSNSKLGMALKRAGARKDYQGALQFWNPSKSGTQSVSALEEGADAFARVLRTKLGLEKVYAGSRLD